MIGLARTASVALGILLATTSLPEAQVAAGLTGAALIAQLRGIVNEFEEAAQSLIAQGNNALAQQQMLLAGILESTIDQVEGAYADSLDKTLSTVSVAEQNIFADLREQVEGVRDLVGTADKAAAARIYQSQGAANQLLNRLPHAVAYPVFYGMAVGDLDPKVGARPSDIEILGFQLSDPRLDRKPPSVKVAGQEISGPDVSVLEDRIDIQVSEALKQQLGIDDTPCNPRKSFPVELTVYYSVKHGWWIFSRLEEKSVAFNANALPGADRYHVTIDYRGTQTDTTWDSRSFATDPVYRSMGCEDSTSASARFEAPEGSRRLQCSAVWIDTSNVKNQSADCAVGGRVATGTGAMRGRDREWTGNCPGGGHGSFRIRGSYEVPVTSTSPVSGERRNFTASAPLGLTAALGIDPALTGVTVDVSISREACAAELDHITVPVANHAARTEQPSDNGRFRAVVQNGSIRISE